MSMSPKKGRPRKNDSESKRKHLDVRLTEDEYLYLDALSKQMGITKSELVLTAVRFFAEQSK